MLNLHFKIKSRNSIARPYANGTLYTNFNPGSGFFPVQVEGTFQNTDRGSVRSMVYEPAVGATSAKLFVSGDFTKYNNAFVQKVVLINCAASGTTGSRDTNFRMDPLGSITTGGPNDNVWSMKKQGVKLILGGKFTTYNGSSALRLTRIKPKVYSIDGFSGELRGGFNYFESEEEIDINISNDINSYLIYPNPTNGLINVLVTNNSEEIKNIKIYNNLGQLVFENNYENKIEIKLDLTTFIKGLYFISVNGYNSNVKKIMLQ